MTKCELIHRRKSKTNKKVCLSLLSSMCESESLNDSVLFRAIYYKIDIGRCGVSANETTLHPNNNL